MPDMAGDAGFFGQLADDGYHVYIYDQIGSGRSSRLDDPTGYTLDRAATNLEHVRTAIGAREMVLIGHSWGGLVATRYLDQHPERVDRLVLSSPGPIPGSADTSDAGIFARTSGADRQRLLELMLHPRILVSYGLLQLNPQASRAFTGDQEMDARFDAVYNASRPALHCPSDDPGPELHGLGFYAYQYPQSATAPEPDIGADLATADVPVLIIKGRCDYLSWSSAIEYTTALRDTTVVYLEHSGHNAYQDQPEAYLAAVRAFLTGTPIPHERSDTSTPTTYLGTPDPQRNRGRTPRHKGRRYHYDYEDLSPGQDPTAAVPHAVPLQALRPEPWLAAGQPDLPAEPHRTQIRQAVPYRARGGRQAERHRGAGGDQWNGEIGLVPQHSR